MARSSEDTLMLHLLGSDSFSGGGLGVAFSEEACLGFGVRMRKRSPFYCTCWHPRPITCPSTKPALGPASCPCRLEDSACYQPFRIREEASEWGVEPWQVSEQAVAVPAPGCCSKVCREGLWSTRARKSSSGKETP